MMQCGNQLDFFTSQNSEKEMGRLLVKGTVIGNPWTLQIYPSQSLSNISDVWLMECRNMVGLEK